MQGRVSPSLDMAKLQMLASPRDRLVVPRVWPITTTLCDYTKWQDPSDLPRVATGYFPVAVCGMGKPEDTILLVRRRARLRVVPGGEKAYFRADYPMTCYLERHARKWGAWRCQFAGVGLYLGRLQSFWMRQMVLTT